MKRFLTFTLALIMIIGLLPLRTYAATPQPKFAMTDPNNTAAVSHGVAPGETYYVVFENVTDATTGEVIGNKPVMAETTPTDNYIKYYYNGAKNVFEITFKNINYQRTKSGEAFLTVSNNFTSSVTYTNTFDVVLTLEGTNSISGRYGNDALQFKNNGNLTITGDNLTVDVNYTSYSFLQKSNSGDLIFLNTTIDFANTYTGTGASGCFTVDGNLIVDGSNLTMRTNKGVILVTGSRYGTMSTDTTKGITIKHGSNIDFTTISSTMLKTRGPILFDNSNVSLVKGTSNNEPVFNRAPKLIGTYKSKWAGKGTDSNGNYYYHSYPGYFGHQPGDVITKDTFPYITHFKLVHKHYPTDCTVDSLCACTKETIPASAEEHILETVEAKAVTCTEAGWKEYQQCKNCSYSTKVEIPATGSHKLIRVEAKAPTCINGWEAYEYCEVCNYTTKVELPATDEHTMVAVAAKDPTCGEEGWHAHTACSVCAYSEDKVKISPTYEHTIVEVEGKAPTCTEPGWEAYKYCSVCDIFNTKVELPATEKIKVKPFYVLNGHAPWNPTPYVLHKPSLYTNTAYFTDTTGKIPFVSIDGSGESTIPTIAAKLKKIFDQFPAGTRYFKLDAMAKSMTNMVRNNVYYDEAVDAVKEWMEAFLVEYYRIGGKLDGIQVDTEYVDGGAWYVYGDDNDTENHALYKAIVNDERYETDLRPWLVAFGFPFYTGTYASSRTEIYNITGKSGSGVKAWDVVNRYRMAQAIEEAVYKPLLQYYPNALMTDYQVRYVNGWQKTVNSSASPMLYNSVGIGATSNFNAYAVRPSSSIYGGDGVYGKPPSYNAAAYNLTPFNRILWETNIFRNMYEAAPEHHTGIHVTFFNYERNTRGTYSNTPYYSESMFHIAMMDPEFLMGYILENEVFAYGKGFDDPNICDLGYSLDVVHDLMAEMTRVAGASDRKYIPAPAYWNSQFLLSGMYAGGRNIWRITPETATGVSLDEFLVNDKAPTFYIDGQTIIFPQGRIIKDGKVRQVGTCGYWVETPAGVEPIIINDTDRYSKYPSFQENFEGYAAGSLFDSTTGLPKTCWEVTGTATVQKNNGSNALALTGTTSVKSVKMPANITAGDFYAKQQAWEVTVTLPTSGELKLLNCTDTDPGVKISGGKMYYANGTTYQQLSGVTPSAGSAYTIRREIDLRTAGSFKSSYAIYDANGSLLGSVDNVSLVSFDTAKVFVALSANNVTGTAYMDDFKLYPTGVTTGLEAYDVFTGYRLASATEIRTEDTAYRLSWMNATGEYKIAKVLNNGVVVAEIKMAPGEDGVNTGIVKGSNINLSVVTEDDTAPATAQPDYSTGDFDWTAAAEALGLASGKSNGKNIDLSGNKTVISHNLVKVEAKAPTCTESGWNAYEYCKNEGCGYTTYAYLPACGHDISSFEAKDPTCTEVGWHAYETCATCGYSSYVELPALGHDIIYHDEKIPTFQESGWNAYETCARCDYTTYKKIATVQPKIQVTWPGKYFQKGLDEINKNYYIQWSDGIPKLTYEEPVGGYIKFRYVSDGGKPILYVTFKDVTHVTTGSSNAPFLKIYENNGHSNAFDVLITLEGTNLLDGYKSGIQVSNNGNLTVTGNGSLTIDSTESSTKAFTKSGTGTVLIKDTTFNLSLKSTSSGLVYGIYVSNDLTIEGSVVNVHTGKGSAPVYSVQGVVTIRNSDFDGSQTSGGRPVISSKNPVVFENSNVILKKSTSNAGHCLAMAPQIVGTYSGQWCSKDITGEASTLKNYEALNYSAGDIWPGGKYYSDSYSYFKLEHQCIAQPDDSDCTTPVKCVCGREVVAGKAHTPADAVIENASADSYDSVIYCSVCSQEVSRITICNHIQTEIQNAKPATCTETGYTGDKVCVKCGETLTAGNVIPSTGHDYKSVTTDATCTENGKIVYTCTKCNHSYEQVITATGHTEVVDKAVAPTCTETGLTEGKHCSVCDEVLVKQEVVVATGHTEVIDKAVAPTCTETGLTEGKHCSVCDKVLIAQENIPATGHDYKSITTDATCTENGKTVYTCANCNHSYEQVITATGHTEVVDKAVAPTCTETGLTEGKHCSVCDKVLIAQENIPATGHDYKSITTDATCTENGKTVYTCTKCNHSYEQVITATGHTEVVDKAVAPTCTETGLTEGKHCSVCDAVLVKQEVVAATGHDYKSETTDATCTENGKTVYTCTKCNHSYEQVITATGHTEMVDKAVAPTCTETGLTEGKHCSVCDKVLIAQENISATGHKYKTEVTQPTCTEKGYTTYTCHCGDSYIADYVDATGHSHTSEVTKEPTCEEKGEKTFTCACGDTYTQEIIEKGHTPGEWNATAMPTCTEPGAKERVCSVCGRNKQTEAIPVVPHNMVYLEAKESTCTVSGLTAGQYCKNCTTQTIEQKTTPVKGHTPGQWVEIKAPSCKEPGAKERFCLVCGENKETEQIPVTDHKFTILVETVAPTVSAPGYKVFKCETCDKTEMKRVAQLRIPTLVQNENEVILNDPDSISVQMGVTFVGLNSGVNIADVANWGNFIGLNGKALNGRTGYTNLATAKDVSLLDCGDYVFYVNYKNGGKNVIFFTLITIEGRPTINLSGNTATVNDNGNTIVQTGVKYVGLNSAIDATKISSWGEFVALEGKTLTGKNGYTNNGTAREVMLLDNGDYVFYVIYKSGGKNVTFYELVTVNVSGGSPSVNISGNTATLEANGNTIVQSGVKYVGENSVVEADRIAGWGGFVALSGKALNGKSGYTNNGTATEVKLLDNGDYIFYVIYKDANGTSKTVFLKITVKNLNDKPAINVEDGTAILIDNDFAVIQSGVKFVGENSTIEADKIVGWGGFTALSGQALNGKPGYTNLGKETQTDLTRTGDYIFYVIYKDAAGVSKTAFYKVTL